jgi:hypothetical protein
VKTITIATAGVSFILQEGPGEAPGGMTLYPTVSRTDKSLVDVPVSGATPGHTHTNMHAHTRVHTHTHTHMHQCCSEQLQPISRVACHVCGVIWGWHPLLRWWLSLVVR